nr:pyruvate dehydrogenase [uncultured Capnocytophaga sp.]
MGYYMFAYGVKTSELQPVFSSKNEALLDEVQKDEIFQNYAEEDDDNEITKALTDIIMGLPFDEKKGYTYGYAFIGICAILGKKLPFTEEIKFWYETDLINKALFEDYDIEVEIDTELFPADHFHPFPLPEIEDYPMISLIDQDRLRHLASLLEKVHKTKEEIEALIEDDDDEERGFAYEHIMGLKENISFCLNNQLDMIAFCH